MVWRLLYIPESDGKPCISVPIVALERVVGQLKQKPRAEREVDYIAVTSLIRGHAQKLVGELEELWHIEIGE